MSFFCGPMFKWEDTTHFDDDEGEIVPMKSVKMKCMKLMLMEGMNGDNYNYYLFIIKFIYNYYIILELSCFSLIFIKFDNM